MMELVVPFAIKGAIAFACGFFIGLERELRGKSAGLRTSVLICIGSTLFTAIGCAIAAKAQVGDPTRVFAQVVSGIGFLGAGVILKSNGSIFGITTASTIWLTAAVGVAIGVGYEVVGVYTTIAVLITLIGLKFFETHVLEGFGLARRNFTCEVVVKNSENPFPLTYLVSRCEDLKLPVHHKEVERTSSSETLYRVRYHGAMINSDRLLEGLNSDSRVLRVSISKA